MIPPKIIRTFTLLFITLSLLGIASFLKRQGAAYPTKPYRPSSESLWEKQIIQLNHSKTEDLKSYSQKEYNEWLFYPSRKEINLNNLKLALLSYKVVGEELTLTFEISNLLDHTVGIGILPTTYITTEEGRKFDLLKAEKIGKGCNSIGISPLSVKEQKVGLRFSLVFPKSAAVTEELKVVSTFGIDDPQTQTPCDKTIPWTMEHILLSEAKTPPYIESFSLDGFDSSVRLKDALPPEEGPLFLPPIQEISKFSRDPESGLLVSRTRLIVVLKENTTVGQTQNLLKKIEGTLVGIISGNQILIDIPDFDTLAHLKNTLETVQQNDSVIAVSEDTLLGVVE